MKKLKLDVDDLRVESFQTERGGASRGTVVAAEYGDPVSVVEPESGNIYCLTAQPCIPTNEETGGCYSCQASCAASCDCYTPGCTDLY